METAAAPENNGPTPARPQSPSEVIEYYYGQLDWRILPMHGTVGTGPDKPRICCCGDGENCVNPGKHPIIKYKKEPDQTGKRAYRPRPSFVDLKQLARKHVDRGAPANWAVA